MNTVHVSSRRLRVGTEYKDSLSPDVPHTPIQGRSDLVEYFRQDHHSLAIRGAQRVLPGLSLVYYYAGQGIPVGQWLFTEAVVAPEFVGLVAMGLCLCTYWIDEIGGILSSS